MIPPERLSYPPELPIVERRAEILAAFREHQVVIVAGETGSGKSTQLPKFCLELDQAGLIGHTQPRRLAARAVAERVAHEIGTDVGAEVGYAVRFTDKVGPETRVKVMTDGILLAEIGRDRDLRRYSTIIVDEAHERSLNIDFLLGYLTRLLPRRPDLKLVVTSATIDTERFAAHFDAPVIEVSGRTYPVDILYRPFGEEPDDDRDQVAAICDAVEEIAEGGPGDALVFLSGEREIRDTADAINGLGLRDLEVLPLYARLSAAEQHRIFAGHPGRRIVLATNVAETSLTVPGIRYVIDAGTARISRYSRRLKVQRLPIEAVSQASANQRAGRCGRVGPGTCIRLYSEEDFAARPEFTEPEILRTNLASVVLQMAALRLGDVGDFPFIEPPDHRTVADGVALCEELGAFEPGRRDERPRLTRIGRRLARMPIDPRLARMVLEGERNGCVRETVIIATALSIQDPRERPSEKREAAAEKHRRFRDDRSDFLAYLNLWDHLRSKQKELSSNQFRKLCRSEYINYLRVREWQDLERQVKRVATDLDISITSAPDDPDAIHRSVLAGLLSQIGMWDPVRKEYRGAREARFALVRDSVLSKKSPNWVMVGQLVETNRLWGRTGAGIRPDWVEKLGGHLVKYSYGEPDWDATQGRAITSERVTLYGLPIVAGRRVGYARVDAEAARDMFIENALVRGDWERRPRIIDENLAAREEAAAVQDRARRGDLLLGDDAVFDFYDRRIGDDVVSGGHFDRWWNKTRRNDPDLLSLRPDDLIDPEAEPVDEEAFPQWWQLDGLRLALSYVFDPTSPHDGVTVHVPVTVLNQLRPDGFDWQVPGLRHELVSSLLRGLPKSLRRRLVPVPDRAAEILSRFGPDDGALLDVLGDAVRQTTGLPVARTDWRPDDIPDHLRVTFLVEDTDGSPIAESKDLGALRQHLAATTHTQLISGVGRTIERRGMTTWDLDELPERIEATDGGRTLVGYPALVDEGDSVAVRVLATSDEAERAHRSGVRRLVILSLPSVRKTVARELPRSAQMALAASAAGRLTSVLDDGIEAAAADLVGDADVRDAEAFSRLRSQVKGELVPRSVELVTAAAALLDTRRTILDRLAGLSGRETAPAVDDIGEQVERLTGPGFISRAGADRLDDLGRYLRAIGVRLDRLPADPGRDARHLVEVRTLERQLAEIAAVVPPDRSGQVDLITWRLEELRVSLFAQQVGARGKVSVARLRRELSELNR